MSIVKTITFWSSAARTASTVSSTVYSGEVNRSYTGSTGYASKAQFSLDVTTSSGTAPTMQLEIQKQVGSGSWMTIPELVFLGVTTSAAGPQIINYNQALPANLRAVATMTGTTPSFTFALECELVG